MTDLDEALRMLDTFASVSATHFDLTHINIEGEKQGFRPRQSLAPLKNLLPKPFPGATARQNNIIVRPISDTVQFVQLDDLDEAQLKRAGEAAFLTLQTSPGNHQAWIAVSGLAPGEETKEFARKLCKRGRGRPVRIRRNTHCRHDELQTQIRAGLSQSHHCCRHARPHRDSGYTRIP